MRYFFIKRVVLQVQNCNLRHFHEDLWDDGLGIYVVVREIESGEGRTIK
jgi:hypothetical protein